MKKKYSNLNFIGVMGILMMTIIIAAIFGSADISVGDFFKTLLSRVPILGDAFEPIKSHEIIIFNLRLPRIMLALIAGIGLAVTGTVFQGVFSNPMAEPYLLGVSSGAAFGATLAAVLGIQIRVFSFGTISIFAFVGAFVVVFVIYKMAVVKGVMPVSVLLLSGLAINYFLNAIITLLMTFNQDKIESVYFWTLGSFKNATWEKVGLVGVVVLISIIYIYRYASELDLIMLGDDQAKSLGVEVDRTKKRLLLVSSLVAAVVVASSGIIGFVGLIIPHGARMITGPSHRKLMPFAGISGGIFLIICDTIARTSIENKELSVGIITAICGVPFFLWLLYKNRKVVGS